MTSKIPVCRLFLSFSLVNKSNLAVFDSEDLNELTFTLPIEPFVALFLGWLSAFLQDFVCAVSCVDQMVSTIHEIGKRWIED